ncbi:MAG: ABC transporter permease [Thermoproteus sp.]
MLAEAQLAWGALRERKGRTVGAIIGVLIAFVALTFALSVGDAFKAETLKFFEGLGVNNVFVLGRFTDADVATIATYAAPYATSVVPISVAMGSVRLPNGRVESVNIYGIPGRDIGVVVPSSALYAGSDNIGGSLAVVGYYVAFDQNTGAQLLSVGYPLTLNYGGRSYTVVVSGIMAPEHPGVINTLDSVILDEPQFRSMTGQTGYQIVVVSLKDTKYLGEVQSLLKAAFPDAQIVNLLSLVQTLNQFFTGLELFLGLVSGVSTVITALWLYDTMTISVLQRTKEFGILRAVGFKRKQITAMMLYEALIIAAVGIAAGIVVVALLSLVPIGFFPGMSIHLTIPLHIAVATAALVVAVNTVGALAPAVRAGRLNVVDALRYE